jgi:outer membrane murein-binding lipoprotein Lpp
MKRTYTGRLVVKALLLLVLGPLILAGCASVEPKNPTAKLSNPVVLELQDQITDLHNRVVWLEQQRTVLSRPDYVDNDDWNAWVKSWERDAEEFRKTEVSEEGEDQP